jgi:hypothetical protein
MLFQRYKKKFKPNVTEPNSRNVRSEFFMKMNINVFSNVTHFTFVDRYQTFEGTCYFKLEISLKKETVG